LNQIYRRVWVYFNFFQPVMRLVVKETLPAENGRPARVRRRFDRARPPPDRLCETGVLPEQKQQELWRYGKRPTRLNYGKRFTSW